MLFLAQSLVIFMIDFFFFSFLVSAPLCFSFLTDANKINLISFIYLSTLKSRLRTSVASDFSSGHNNCALGMTTLNVSNVTKIIKYHKFDGKKERKKIVNMYRVPFFFLLPL